MPPRGTAAHARRGRARQQRRRSEARPGDGAARGRPRPPPSERSETAARRAVASGEAQACPASLLQPAGTGGPRGAATGSAAGRSRFRAAPAAPLRPRALRDAWGRCEPRTRRSLAPALGASRFPRGELLERRAVAGVAARRGGFTRVRRLRRVFLAPLTRRRRARFAEVAAARRGAGAAARPGCVLGRPAQRQRRGATPGCC